MFNLANCRLHCSGSRGRCFKRLGAEARRPGCFRFVPRKRHTTTSHFLPQTKVFSQLAASV
jgi:hypothetical protein